MNSIFRVSKLEFDRTAPYYMFRQPYSDEFFHALKQHLQLNDQTIVLDIACGSGELSVGISPFVNKVIAFDYSQDMLDKARRAHNVDYVLHDLSASPFLPGILFDHVLIGRAIPYLPISTLGPTLNNLKPEGRVVVCGAIFHPSTVWMPEYEALKNKYRAYKPEKGIFNGIEKMSQLGYQLKDSFSVITEMTCTLDYVANNLLSIQSCTEKILENQAGFQADLNELFRPYLENGQLTGGISSWANVFGKEPKNH